MDKAVYSSLVRLVQGKMKGPLQGESHHSLGRRSNSHKQASGGERRRKQLSGPATCIAFDKKPVQYASLTRDNRQTSIEGEEDTFIGRGRKMRGGTLRVRRPDDLPRVLLPDRGGTSEVFARDRPLGKKGGWGAAISVFDLQKILRGVDPWGRDVCFGRHEEDEN